MDSFVLSETFKYLYLLFSKPNELPINIADYVFTTEAHLLPLSLARMTGNVSVPSSDMLDGDLDSSAHDTEFFRSCPNAHYIYPGKQQFAENIRKPLKNYVDSFCPNRQRPSTLDRKLLASDFQVSNAGHIKTLRDMGINLLGLSDGRIQLVHTSANAKTREDAEEGLLFMQEMVELSKLQQDQPDHPPKAVIYAVEEIDYSCIENLKRISEDLLKSGDFPRCEEISPSISVKTLTAGPAQFGLQLKDGITVEGKLVIASPFRACTELENEVKGKIVLLERGDCLFVDKARIIQKLGAIGGVVVDNSPMMTSYEGDSSPPPLFAMSGDDSSDDVTIPMVFLFRDAGQELLKAHGLSKGGLTVLLSDHPKSQENDNSILTVDSSYKTDKVTVEALLAAKSKARIKGEETDNLITLVGEDEATSRGEDEITSRGEDETTTRGEDETTTRGEDETTTRGEDEAKSRGEDLPASNSDSVLLSGEGDVLASATSEELIISLKKYLEMSSGREEQENGLWLISRIQVSKHLFLF